MGYLSFSDEDLTEIFDRYAAGESEYSIVMSFGQSQSAVKAAFKSTKGVRPVWRRRADCQLSLEERETISRGIVAGDSLRTIASALRRSPSTVSREVRRNGGRENYRATTADRRADHVAGRPKAAKLARCARLRSVVQERLEEKWSPRQISKWLAQTFPDDGAMRVSHETIYQSLYVQGRGALRKELHQALRSGRAHRRPQGRYPKGFGQIPNMVMISERPADVEDRAVPGHWEGDLIKGRNNGSCIGTLVERSTRYVLLLKLEHGRAEEVREAMTRKILTLPEQLRRSITWDQGKEMSEHARFTVDTGVNVFFCDPHSPWQRGTNENTNGLLRQYFPKGTVLSVHSEEHLDAVARQLNGRPRETLGWDTPARRLAELVASTA
jgi:transposase, IS30 family